jgi:hypothetical protein
MFRTDKKFLDKLTTVINELKQREQLQDDQQIILGRLEEILQISIGKSRLIIDQKLYKGSYRWLSELGEIAYRKLGYACIDFCDYFADHYKVPAIP